MMSPEVEDSSSRVAPHRAIAIAALLALGISIANWAFVSNRTSGGIDTPRPIQPPPKNHSRLTEISLPGKRLATIETANYGYFSETGQPFLAITYRPIRNPQRSPEEFLEVISSIASHFAPDLDYFDENPLRESASILLQARGISDTWFPFLPDADGELVPQFDSDELEALIAAWNAPFHPPSRVFLENESIDFSTGSKLHVELAAYAYSEENRKPNVTIRYRTNLGVRATWKELFGEMEMVANHFREHLDYFRGNDLFSAARVSICAANASDGFHDYIRREDGSMIPDFNVDDRIQTLKNYRVKKAQAIANSK